MVKGFEIPFRYIKANVVPNRLNAKQPKM
jgi:hypothetical protein